MQPQRYFQCRILANFIGKIKTDWIFCFELTQLRPNNHQYNVQCVQIMISTLPSNKKYLIIYYVNIILSGQWACKIMDYHTKTLGHVESNPGSLSLWIMKCPVSTSYNFSVVHWIRSEWGFCLLVSSFSSLASLPLMRRSILPLAATVPMAGWTEALLRWGIRSQGLNIE